MHTRIHSFLMTSALQPTHRNNRSTDVENASDIHTVISIKTQRLEEIKMRFLRQFPDQTLSRANAGIIKQLKHIDQGNNNNNNNDSVDEDTTMRV